ncbi:MAG: hypothetical protein J4G05_03395 [Chlorobi bacterium]|nr:hypothetical protein [Chlorobiota bacterium]
MIQRLQFLILSVFLLHFSALTLIGQDRSDPSTMGTARSSIATSRGISSLFTNPGGLDYFAIHESTLPHDVVFSIYSGGGSIGGSYLKGDEFNQIFGSLEGTSNEQREKIGKLLVDERLFANGGINFLSGIWRLKDGAGTIGLRYGSRAYARINFPDSLPKLIETNNIAEQDFRFVNRGIGVTWLTEFGLSYGKVIGNQTDVGWFPSIGLGLTAKLISGVGHFEVTDNSAIFIDQINVNGRLRFLVRGGYVFQSAEPDQFDQVNAPTSFFSSPFPTTAGFGYGFDLGVNGILYYDEQRTFHYGLTVDNVGKVRWTNKARERRASDFNDTLGARLTNAEFERFEGELVGVDSYSSILPAAFRAGLGLTMGANDRDFQGTLTFGLEGEVPLNQVPGNTPDPRLALGVDWSLVQEFGLRTGLSVGGISDVGLGLGFGFRPRDWLAIDIGTSELNSVISGDRLDVAGRIAIGLTP